MFMREHKMITQDVHLMNVWKLKSLLLKEPVRLAKMEMFLIVKAFIV